MDIYCNQQQFDGESLQKFWDQITNFGARSGGFGVKFVQKICGQYSLKFGKFARSKKHVGIWTSEILIAQLLIFGYVDESERKLT